MELVEEGEVDMGFLARPVMGPAFEFRSLFPYERVLIAPLGHPLLRGQITNLEQIAAYPLILRNSRSYTRTILENEFRRKGIHFDVSVELDNVDMIKRYVALGMGVSVGPKLAIEPEDERVLGVASLAALLPIDQGGIVTLRGKSLSTPALDFIKVMESVSAPNSISAEDMRAVASGEVRYR